MPTSRTEFQKIVDAAITTYLNDEGIVQDFLAQAVSELSQQLASTDISLKFFVKGGTALKLLNGPPYDGTWSDWDTQLIIDPELPVPQWYAAFDTIDAQVIEHLVDMQKDGDSLSDVIPDTLYYRWEGADKTKGIIVKQEPVLEGFYYILTLDPSVNTKSTLATRSIHPLQVFDNAKSLLRDETEERQTSVFEKHFPFKSSNLDRAAGNSAKTSILVNHTIKDFHLYRLLVKYQLAGHKLIAEPDGKPVPPYVTISPDDVIGFRGELLDISIPRRWTEEALNQWDQKQVGVQQMGFRTKFVPIPTWRYHAKENITLIAEVLTGSSNSGHKVMKRVKRGARALRALYNDPSLVAELPDIAAALTTASGTLYGVPIEKIHEQFSGPDPTQLPESPVLLIVLFWLLNSLEQDFGLSSSLNEDQKNTFQKYFHMEGQEGVLRNKINKAFDGITSISAVDKAKFSQEEKDLVGAVSMMKEITSAFKIDLEAEGIFDSLRQAIKGVIFDLNEGAKLASLGPVSSAYFRLKYLQNDSPPNAYLFPYIDIYTNSEIPISEPNLRLFNTELHAEDIDTFGALGLPTLHDSKILQELNKLLATSENYFVLHWLTELRDSYHTALSNT